jgi:hypothetical protein
MDFRDMLPVSHPTPGAAATEKEKSMDLATALVPLFLAEGLVFEPGHPETRGTTYVHPVTKYAVTIDPGMENWIAVWDQKEQVVCEARVVTPEQAIRLVQVWGFLTTVDVTDV